MSFGRNPFRPFFASFAAVLLLSVAAVAQTAEQHQQLDLTQVKIKNFGQMDARFFRGGQPKEEEDYKALAALGIKTVIDLQAEPKEYEKQFVESLGMRYVNIPMIEKKYPKPEHVAEFMKLVDNPETGKFFVHCAGGRHRTGSMGAVYRYEKYGWDFEQVYKEMKDFDFYTRWGHGDFKKFVQDYGKEVQERSTASTIITSIASPAAAAAAGAQR